MSLQLSENESYTGYSLQANLRAYIFKLDVHSFIMLEPTSVWRKQEKRELMQGQKKIKSSLV